ncbi:MAG: MarR family transcriptional regulator [Lachnospiraceae bacterium]|nr:MarR family transcriptional regulator [Lachnospiraceae bacterium]
MRNFNEELLSAWLSLSSTIRNDRLVAAMSFNEIQICNQLYRAQMEGKDLLTATDLCQKTGLLKSQMNKVLKGLEKKEVIIRERSTKDKRKIFICLKEDNISIYQNEHARVMDFVNALADQMGEADVKETIRLLNKIADTAKAILEN